METQGKDNYVKFILFVIAIGIWALVLQNAGVVPGNQEVYVTGGSIDIDRTVKVDGSVNVKNTVDVNIHEINGYNEVITRSGKRSVFPYGYMLPVDSW